MASANSVTVLIVMTLAVLWLNPTSSERMTLAAVDLICHLLCVIDVNWQVPFNGSSLPSICKLKAAVTIVVRIIDE